MLIIKLSCFSVCFCQDANSFCLFNGGILFANIEHLKNKKLKGKTAATLLSNGGTERKSLKNTLCFDFELTEHLGIYLATFQVSKKYFSRYNTYIGTYICLMFLQYCFQFFKDIHPPVTTYILQFL